MEEILGKASKENLPENLHKLAPEGTDLRAGQDVGKSAMEDPDIQAVMAQGEKAEPEVKKRAETKIRQVEFKLGKILVNVGFMAGITIIVYLMLLRMAANGMGGNKNK